MRNEDMDKEIQKAYEELEKQEDRLKAQLKQLHNKKKPLRAYLREIGVLQTQKRNRQPEPNIVR